MDWEFNVLDGASDPLKQMDRQFGNVEKELKKVDGELYKLERHMKILKAEAMTDPMKQKAALMRIYRDDLRHATGAHKETTGAMSEMKDKLTEIRNLEAARTVVELGEKVFELGKRFAEATIEAADFRHESLVSLEAMLGTKEGAEEELETLERMSRGTKDTTAQMMSSFQELFSFTQKYGKKATEDVIAAGEDIKAGLGEAAQGKFIDVIRNVEAMGKFDERSMKLLKQVGVATPEKMLTALAASHHTTTAQIKAMLKAGQISSAEGINEMLTLVQNNLDKGGPLGGLSQKLAKGDVGVQIKNLKQSFEEIFAKVDTGPLIKALDRVGKMLDPGTESGKRFAETIGKVFGVVTKFVDFITDPTTIAAASVIFGAIGTVFGAIGTAIKWTGERLGDFVFWVVDGSAKAWDAISAFASRTFSAGKSIVDGLWDGIRSAWHGMLDKFHDLVGMLPASVRKILGIASPSKVFEQMGQFTGEGFTLGVEASMPDISKMTDIMLPMPKFASPSFDFSTATQNATPPAPDLSGLANIAAPSGGGGGSKTFEFTWTGNVIVHGAGKTDSELADLIGETIATKARAEIVRFMEDDSISD